METKEAAPQGKLAKGQLWKLDEGYIYIVQPGKRLVEYKILKDHRQKSVMARMIGIEKLEAYLMEHRAELVQGVSAN